MLRSWRPGLPWLGLGALAAVSASVSLAQDARLPATISAIVAIGAPALAAILKVQATRASARLDEQAQVARQLPGQIHTTPHGRPPRVRDAPNGLVLGVHPAATLKDEHGHLDRIPPYVPRDIDSALQQVVSAPQAFIILLGDSTAGKTRTAYQLMLQMLPEHILIAPVDRDSVLPAFDQARAHSRVVIWLNDLERYLGPGGLTVHVISRLFDNTGQHRVIIATLRTTEYDRFQEVIPDPTIAPRFLRDVHELLDLADTFLLNRRWSAAEIRRAYSFTADSRISSALSHADTYGVGEYLAAGPRIQTAWRAAWAPRTGENPVSHPRAAALIAAAVDAYRAGYTRPIPADLLELLHQHYLHLHGGALLRPESMGDAIDWATAPFHATSSPLMPHDEGETTAFSAFDYLIDAADTAADSAPIPETTWRNLIAHAAPEHLVDIGLAANRRHQHNFAALAFDRAVDRTDDKVRDWHAYSLGLSGRYADAAVLYNQLAIDRAQALGSDHPDTLASRANHAGLLGEAGHPAEAAALLERLSADYIRILGPDHPDTLASRANHAGLLGVAGHPAEAAALLERLSADYIRILGPDHPDTLAIRANHAGLLGIAGRPAEAAAPLERLKNDLVALNISEESSRSGVSDPPSEAMKPGPRSAATRRNATRYGQIARLGHPGILNGRRDYARALAQAGNPAAAINLFSQLTTDCERVLGPNHPDTLSSRHNHARFTGLAGHPGRSTELLEPLIADYVQVLGPEHPDTLSCRHDHARFLGEAGQFDDAISLMRDLSSDYVRILGSEHPDTFSCRHDHARFIGLAGSPAEAASLLEQLVVDRVRALGADHPYTLGSRSGHARFVGLAGDPRTAASLLEQLTIDRMRILGPDHPDTLSSRHHHAQFVGNAGQVQAAAIFLGQLTIDRIRVLGPDHPDTLSSRHDYGHFVGLAGDPGRAADLLAQLIPDRERILGPDNSDTLKSREALYFWSAEARQENTEQLPPK